MGELASLGRTSAPFRKVWTLADMLHLAVETFGTIAEDCKVATNAMSLAHANVRERTILPGTPPVVRKMNTEGSAFWDRVMRKIAGLGGVGTVAMQKVPADRNLVGVVLVHTSETTAAGTWAAVV